MPSPAPLAPELVAVKRWHYVPGVGATRWELAECLRQHQQDPDPNGGSDDPSDAV